MSPRALALASILSAATSFLASCAAAPPPPAAPPPTVSLPPTQPGPTPPPVVLVPVPSEPALDLHGVDTERLDGRERREWGALVGELMAPCPSVAVSVAQCVQERRDCRACVPAAAWVARAVHDGRSSEQIRAGYRSRFDPAAVATLPLDGSPSKGDADAPVTIVEFIDFECPHCRIGAQMVDSVFADHPGKVRVVLKSYPLSSHPHAEAAAKAAFAAQAQGKFWEMARQLLEKQDHLEPRDLEGYARSLNLNMTRWRADAASPAVAGRVADDRKLGDDLKLKGTPTFFVDGRELGEDDTIEERVRDALGPK